MERIKDISFFKVIYLLDINIKLFTQFKDVSIYFFDTIHLYSEVIIIMQKGLIIILKYLQCLIAYRCKGFFVYDDAAPMLNQYYKALFRNITTPVAHNAISTSGFPIIEFAIEFCRWIIVRCCVQSREIRELYAQYSRRSG